MTNRRKPGPTRTGPVIPAAVRRWLYGIAAALAPVAVVYGYATDSEAVLWLNVAGAVLFIMAVGNTPTRDAEAHHETGDPQ